jgi:hypothetical protein
MISWTRRFDPNAFSRLLFSDRGKRGDEPRSNSVMRKRCFPYPARLERGEYSGLPLWS